MADVFLEVNRDSRYPSPRAAFSPDAVYPEYPWDCSCISNEKNFVYDMVRACLIGLNLDPINIGTNRWNPFGELINEGDTVLVKPNWVTHQSASKTAAPDDLEHLITHPSVVRAVVDYCIIALRGSGRIVVGDAPMQGCDLAAVMQQSGYNNMFAFYEERQSNVHAADFREYAALVDRHKVLVGRKDTGSQGCKVEMDGASRFSSNDLKGKRYRVSDYAEGTTTEFHHDGTHTYLVSKEALLADVVINVPKPKCHRLAGLTGAMKNIVGITYNKSCLPHRTVGSLHEGGDEYLYASTIKEMIGYILGLKIDFEHSGNHNLALLMRWCYGLLYYLMRATSRDKYLLGSWYGNDTAWRMILDLNHILLYADKNAHLTQTHQRKVFNVADMIVSGQRNGPVSPEPKKLGIILAGTDSVVIDRLICEVMGFDHTKVPSVHHAITDAKLTQKSIGECVIGSNLAEYANKHIDELRIPKEWRFVPHDSWRGFVEQS